MDFDDVLDFVFDIFSFDWVPDLWEGFLEFWTFEWIGEVWDFILGVFTLGEEFSYAGLFFGLCAVLVMYLSNILMFGLGGNKNIIDSMLQYLPGFQRILWTIIDYVVIFIVGYFIGRHMFEDE